MELNFNPFIRGHGFWKFNNSLLYDDVYVEKVKQTIQEVKKQYRKHSTKHVDDPNYIEIVDYSILLKVLLIEIRGITIHTLLINKRPMGHIAHLRKQFKSINTDYIITLIKTRKKNHYYLYEN